MYNVCRAKTMSVLKKSIISSDYIIRATTAINLRLVFFFSFFKFFLYYGLHTDSRHRFVVIDFHKRHRRG